ncbi:Alpha/Beta hydrolase protein [Lentinula raphanica]|nr:Alpha/Beta hydrolase protein [Lentinula raphanica]
MPSLPPDGSFELDLRMRHLEQLRNVEIPMDHYPETPWPSPPGAPTPYEQLVEWSMQAQSQIQAAVANQVVSQGNINWDNEILTLLESAALSLRDTSKVFEAVIESRKQTEEGDERALQLLSDSQADIKKIAALWGLNFEVICDLLKYSPEGHPFMNGPFAGVFYSRNTNKPFLGLAFKGTNMKDWKEIFVDLKSAMTMAIDKILWGSPIHQGFYQTMFLEFPNLASAPLDYIKRMIDTFLQTYVVPSDVNIYLHVTGHSLGGAYATLCYAEFMRLYNNDPAVPLQGEEGEESFFSQLKERQFLLQDLYTFGCPRLGGVMDQKDWAYQYASALQYHEGQSWRVVNEYDPVAAMPPIIPYITTWNHVDNGYQISDQRNPQPLPSEVGTQPGTSIKPWNYPYHSPASYFQNLYNASVAGQSPSISIGWIEEVPSEEKWSEMEALAEALLAE